MSLFNNIPKDVDKIEARKKMNRMIAEARKNQNLQNVFCVAKLRQVSVILIQYQKCF